jgi:hypothetical protein
VSGLIEQELRQALALVEGASIPDDLRPVAFASAFWAAREAGAPLAPASPLAGDGSAVDSISTPGLEGDGLGRISAKLGVTQEDVEFVYELEGDKLALRVPPSRLAPVLKDAVKQIIYLVAAGRQAGGFDEKIPAREIKAVCVERGKADTNFSRIINQAHGEGLIIGGSGQAKTIRVNADGFERAGQIIKQLRTSND